MEIAGLISYLIFFLTFVGIYGLLALGLNSQWGYTGMLNLGIAAFFAVGSRGGDCDARCSGGR